MSTHGELPITNPISEAATKTAHLESQGSADIKPRPRRPARPNYAKIHAKSLPLDIVPLPAFVPHNPLSLLRIFYALVSEIYTRPSSRPKCLYTGHFSAETRSVHVTDVHHGRALWEMGFFGKGNLSRSEPSWLDREKAKRKAGAGGTSEEATSKRREERRMFKLERARAERETIEEQLRREGKSAELQPESPALSTEDSTANAHSPQRQRSHEMRHVKSHQSDPLPMTLIHPEEAAGKGSLDMQDQDELNEDAPLIDQEHLQLNFCEAFFLSYGLGVLDVSAVSNAGAEIMDASALLTTFATHSTFPPCRMDQIQPDNSFLLSYVVYHHYRSLGWVVRPGAKFAADWLLYNRGPVFSHAEFAVMVIPEYSSRHADHAGRQSKAAAYQQTAQKKWWEMHSTNRVQSQVRKTLVLCYVEVPCDLEFGLERSTGRSSDINVGDILKQYKIRDFVVRRWLANRSRD